MGDGQSTTSVAAMTDAQFTAARVLKPLPNFEQYYQGQEAVQLLGQASRPVPFFDSSNFQNPQYTGRDISAGNEGFDPELLDFIPVPMGSLIKLWIPQFADPDNPLNIQAYRYMIEWRVSDINVYSRDLKGQYHFPKQQPGAPDSSLMVTAQRFVAPSATRSNIINQPETTDPFFGENANVRREYLIVRGGDVPNRPLIPQTPGSVVGVEGVYQQGVLDPAVDAAFAPLPAFLEVELIAGGDRMLITADRFGENGVAVAGASPWDFNDAGFDVGFSVIYGTGALSSFSHAQFNDVGIYVFSGTGG